MTLAADAANSEHARSAQAQKHDFTVKIALGSIGVGICVMALKFGAYWLTGSIALYSDALESFVNIIAAFVALFAIRISAKPADDRHPYGHQKIEYIAAVFEGALILTAAMAVFHAAWGAWQSPVKPNLDPVGIGLNVLASAINGGWSLFLLRKGRALRSPALVADGKHLMSDVVSSLGVLVALLVAFVSGYPWVDSALAGLVGVNILWSGWTLMQESFSSLMDEAAAPEEVERIRATIATQSEGAIEAHDLRTRHSGRTTYVEFHLVVPRTMSVEDAHSICDRIEGKLREDLGEVVTTIHVEPDTKAKHQGIVVL